MGSSMKWGEREECVGLAQRQFLKSLADDADDADFLMPRRNGRNSRNNIYKFRMFYKLNF